MCWRRSKLQRAVCLFAFYMTVYLLVSFSLSPDPKVTFIAEEYHVHDRYVLMYLMGAAPAYSDAEGADVFAARQCGKCFITNNRGFLPKSQYDAILVHGGKSMLTETAASMDPGKRYLMESTNKCLRNKLRGCMREPRITSFSTKEVYTLCSLCAELTKQKMTPKPGS